MKNKKGGSYGKKFVPALLSMIFFTSLILSGCSVSDIRGLLNQGQAPSGMSSSEAGVSESIDTSQEPSSLAQVSSDAEESVTYEAETVTASEESTEQLSEDSSDEQALQSEAMKLVFSDSCYAYSTLNDSEKQIYGEIYTIINSMSSDVKLTTIDADMIDRCFNCVMLDHPEFFFLNGYRTTSYTLAGKVTSVAFSGKYTISQAERTEREKAIESYVNECLAGVPSAGDDYAKVKYIYDYIIKNTDYVSGAADSQNICSVFINRQSVCQGYTLATKYLLDKLGIFCTVVNGTANGENHAWNLVKMDGVYCYVDTTWGDASYRSVNDGSVFNRTNYSYLGADWDVIKTTHVINSMISLPDCTSLDEYYFVREGKYFDNVDLDALKAVFDSAYAAGEETLTIKCSDAAVYSGYKTELFDNQKIFKMIHGDNAKYVTDEDEFTISFSL